MLALRALLLLFLSAFAFGKITDVSVVKDDRVAILLSKPFGFGPDGNLNFTLSDVGIAVSVSSDGQNADLTKLGLYVMRGSDEIAEDPTSLVESSEDCSRLTEAPFVRRLVSFGEESVEDIIGKDSSYTYQYTVEHEVLGNGGLISLLFINCDEDVFVSFNIKVEMYNILPGDQRNYLSVGEIELPLMYLVMCCAFTVGLGIWAYNLWQFRKNAHHIHYLMTALGTFKVLTLLAQCAMYHYIRVTGEADGWNFAYYVFTLFRGVFLFSVIVLIGTGWSYMTPFLGDRESKVLMAVIPLQVVTEIAIAVLDDYSPAKRTWFEWRDLMQLFDIACCAVIIFPIVWRIKHLREAAETDGKAERSLQQLVMFKHFYIMVLAYIYFTRIVVFILFATLPPGYVWVSSFAKELAALVFYSLTALQFRPHGGTGYFQLISTEELELSSL